MALDPIVQAVLAQMAAMNAPPLDTLSVQDARAAFAALRMFDGEPDPVASVENRTIPGPAGEIPVRIYTPDGAPPFGVLVYFHGGGWVVGDLDTHDGTCRSLTKLAGCVTVSVDYRLAPEHKFPIPAEDAFAATQWAAANAASLGGDSAGGNLAAAVTLMARERGGPHLAEQLLIYPVTNFSFDTSSYESNALGYLLTRDVMRWFWDHYLPSEEDGHNPLASPLQAPDLRGLPPALVITAEFDPLCDEGEAGVPVTVSRYDGMIHGFVGLAGIFPQGRRALQESADALRHAFAATPVA